MLTSIQSAIYIENSIPIAKTDSTLVDVESAMSVENAVNFLRLMAADVDFQKAFAEAENDDARKALAVSRGLTFSDSDYETAAAQVAAMIESGRAGDELADDDLEQVAGGVTGWNYADFIGISNPPMQAAYGSVWMRGGPFGGNHYK